nr:hypothetical protein [Tanacetum cinerariifolium]
MLLMQAQENGVVLDEEQFLFITGGQDNVVDEDVDEPSVQDLALNVDNLFQTNECDAFDSDVDEAPTAQTMFTANLSFADPIMMKPTRYMIQIFYLKNTIMITIRMLFVSIMKYMRCMAMYNQTALLTQMLNIQTQLTPEQIFWSKDVLKIKENALKEQTKSSKPIKALMVYPPNTPATLVPIVLPTKSQVKLNIFTLIQLFLEFEKTCKKRITPTGLTEGERGFEQTKECYLTEDIPFFKILKEQFEGIQKAPTKEIKEMKEIFKELETEVDQNVVNRKYDEIERKNLLITNDNLIVGFLSKEVFYIATYFELTASRFTEMHDAHTVVQARYLELKAELFKLNDKIQKDDHNELVKCFSNLEVQINEKIKCVTMDFVKPKVLAPGMYAIDVEPISLAV